jgi:plasmid stability protein
MASLTIRRLEDSTKERLRIRASHHGRSMEAEAREILTLALNEKPAPEQNLAELLRKHFEPFGGVELERLPREPMPEPPSFD